MDCSLEGDWDDIRQLIYEIETGRTSQVIDNVSLTEGVTANAPLALALEISTLTGWQAMFGDRKKLLMGGGIVTALVLAMWMMWPASPAPSAADAVAPAPARGAQQTTKPGAIAPVAPVKLDALTAERRTEREGTKPVPVPSRSAPPAAGTRSWRCRYQNRRKRQSRLCRQCRRSR